MDEITDSEWAVLDSIDWQHEHRSSPYGEKTRTMHLRMSACLGFIACATVSMAGCCGPVRFSEATVNTEIPTELHGQFALSPFSNDDLRSHVGHVVVSTGAVSSASMGPRDLQVVLDGEAVYEGQPPIVRTQFEPAIEADFFVTPDWWHNRAKSDRLSDVERFLLDSFSGTCSGRLTHFTFTSFAQCQIGPVSPSHPFIRGLRIAAENARKRENAPFAGYTYKATSMLVHVTIYEAVHGDPADPIPSGGLLVNEIIYAPTPAKYIAVVTTVGVKDVAIP